MKTLKIGVLMYTYNRTDDARINMEIIRNVWTENDLLKDVVVVHSYNGEKEWWPEKYLEDELLYLENPGHFGGAEILINEGIKCFSEKYSDIDYVVILASDTWLVKPEYVQKLIDSMQKNEKYLATCPWGTTEKDNMWSMGMSLDLSVVNLKWSLQFGLFPLRYAEFVEKYSEVFLYQNEIIYLEKVLAVRFKQAIWKSEKISSENIITHTADSRIYRMREREPVHDERKFFGVKKGRKMYWSNIGLLTHHDPSPKQKALRVWNLKLGEYGKKFLCSKDLSYFNSGFKHNYVKGD